MSGGNVSYNLRPNKSVERQLFIELLSKICLSENQDNSVYVSLGGPQLEDHKTIHQLLGFRNLVSIESDQVVYDRQLFNLRPSSVICKKQTTGDFIKDFDDFAADYNAKRFIVWLDYASANKRYDQLVEYQTLLSKLQADDILKITMNANLDTLGDFLKITMETNPDEICNIFKPAEEKILDEVGEQKTVNKIEEFLQKKRFQILQEQLKDYFPSGDEDDFTYKDMVSRKFPLILCKSIRKASISATQKMLGHIQALPLSIFCYQDGNHLMLTVTIILKKNDDKLSFKNKLIGQGWDYIPDDWKSFTKIDVPNLTAKERLHIEEILFKDEHEVIHGKLPFRLAKSDADSLKVFQQYADHYRRYPSYFQVIL